jgi:hypothetical protein
LAGDGKASRRTAHPDKFAGRVATRPTSLSSESMRLAQECRRLGKMPLPEYVGPNPVMQ